MSVTLSEIAKIAGVSRQAVAAVLRPSGTSKVSKALRSRIEHIVASVNYIPNQSARHLKGISSHTIGLFGAPYANAVESTYSNEISFGFDAHGYNLLTSYGIGKVAAGRAIRDLLSKGVDGVVITTADNPLSSEGLEDVLPFIFCPPAFQPGCDIYVDHASGVYKATDFLLTHGCTRPLFFATSYSRTLSNSPMHEKLRGFREACSVHGRKSKFLTLEQCGTKVSDLLSSLRAQRPDAIIACNDYYAGRIMHLLLDAGVKIPQEVKIIGYDGLSLCDLCPVSLATVIQPIRRKADETVRLLLKRLSGAGATSKPLALKPQFQPSESCGEALPHNHNILPLEDRLSLEMQWNRT